MHACAFFHAPASTSMLCFYPQHGIASFEAEGSSSSAMSLAQDEVMLRFIFSFNEAQVLTQAAHLLSKAHSVYKVNASRGGQLTHC